MLKVLVVSLLKNILKDPLKPIQSIPANAVFYNDQVVTYNGQVVTYAS